MRPDRRRHPPGSRNAAGFTLLEVLVAFVIIALAATVALRSSSVAVRSAEGGGSTAIAALQARSLLDEFGISRTLTEGRTEGVLENGMEWSIQAESRPSPSPLLRAYDITLSVTHGQARVVLETVRLLQAGERS